MRRTHKRDTLIDVYLEIVDALSVMKEYDLEMLALTAGVHKTTLYNWKYCYVMAPRLNTLCAVAEALGYELVLIRKLRRVA